MNKNVESYLEQLYHEKEEFDLDWEKQLLVLTDWAKTNLGISIFFKNAINDIANIEKKEIIISNKHKPEIASYYLLHELGHVLLAKNKKAYKHTYDNVYETFSTNSLTIKILTLQEELEAWKHGLKLAAALGLQVNRKKYEIEKSKCVATYMKWATKQSRKSEKEQI